MVKMCLPPSISHLQLHNHLRECAANRAERPAQKRTKRALALSLLHKEKPAIDESAPDSGSPIAPTMPNESLPISPHNQSPTSASALDGVSSTNFTPMQDPTASTQSLATAEKVSPSGIQDNSMTIEDSVKTFRVFEVLRTGDTSAISKAIKDSSPSSGSLQTIPGTTILHLAIQCAEPHVVEYVISHGASVDTNARDREGNTPLHLAAQLGRASVVRQLLERSDINDAVANRQGRLPIDLARTPEIFQQLQLARSLFIDQTVHEIHGLVTRNEYKRLEHLLVEPRVEGSLDVNNLDLATDQATLESGGTLLHEAARRRDNQLIQILLMHGADPFRRDRKGKLPQDITKDDRTRGILKKSPAAAVAKRGIQEKAILGSPTHRTSAAGGAGQAGKDSREMKGYLKKWTNYTSGYKLRWFALEDGVLSYYKHQGNQAITSIPPFANLKSR